MTVEEVTALLTRIQVHDNRRVDELTIEAWAEAIAEGAPWLTYDAAVRAVHVHVTTSTEYLRLAHLVAIAGEDRPLSLPGVEDITEQFMLEQMAAAKDGIEVKDRMRPENDEWPTPTPIGEDE